MGTARTRERNSARAVSGPTFRARLRSETEDPGTFAPEGLPNKPGTDATTFDKHDFNQDYL